MMDGIIVKVSLKLIKSRFEEQWLSQWILFTVDTLFLVVLKVKSYIVFLVKLCY